MGKARRSEATDGSNLINPAKKTHLVDFFTASVLSAAQLLRPESGVENADHNIDPSSLDLNNLPIEAQTKRLAIVSGLMKEDWIKAKFTEDYVKEAVDARIISALIENESNSNAIEAQFDQLIEALKDYSQEQVVLVPIVGIKMAVDFYSIGKIRLITPATTNQPDLVERRTQLAEKLNEIPALRDWLQAQMYAFQPGVVCAEYRVVADPDRAKELAEQETRRALDLIRFAIPALYPNCDISVGIQAEAFVGTRSRLTTILAEEGFNIRWQRNAARHPHRNPIVDTFELSDFTLGKLDRLGLPIATAILQKQNLTAFEQTLLEALHWFANAQAEQDPLYKFLGLMICLESVLNEKGLESITATIANGVAWLIGEDLKDRRELKTRIGGFYSKRSTISHGGKVEDRITLKDIDELTNIVGAVIKRLLKKVDEFASKKALRLWIEERGLGGMDDDSTASEAIQ